LQSVLFCEKGAGTQKIGAGTKWGN